MAATDDLVQRVARVICEAAGFDPVPSLVLDQARAAITETLAEVERHLSAVQYDPAPYSAMKARLADMRKGVG